MEYSSFKRIDPKKLTPVNQKILPTFFAVRNYLEKSQVASFRFVLVQLKFNVSDIAANIARISVLYDIAWWQKRIGLCFLKWRSRDIHPKILC